MPNVNLTIHMGHLTRDPEVRYTPSGQAVCEFGMAMNRKWTTDSGEKREKVVFIDFQAWGKIGEKIGEVCSKGDTVHVTGSMDQDQWEDKTTGQKRSKLFVRVDRADFVKVKKWSDAPIEDNPSQRHNDPPRKPAPPRDPDLDPDEEEGSIPF